MRARETEFYIGAHQSGARELKTISNSADAMLRYRLGNLCTCNGGEFGHITGPSQQDLILDTSNAAVQLGVKLARRGVYFAFLSTDFANRKIVDYLNQQCGDYFIGPIKGETSSLPNSNWHRDSPHINDSNRHLNHNPPPCFAKDMRQAAETYVRFLKERFVKRYRSQGVRRTVALDQHFFHRFDLEAGFDIPISELMTRRVQPDLACLRGAAKAFDKDLWGCWIAIGYYGGSNYDPNKPLRWQVSLYAAYIHGARLITQESGHLAVCEYGDKGYLKGRAHPLCRSFRKTLARFYVFTQNHARPKGNPEVNVAFLQGNFDGWGGARLASQPPRRFVWGQKDSGDHWESGAAEEGWDLLDIAYPRFPQGKNTTDHFSGAPLGQIDIAPATATAEKLSRYKCLIMPAWNTMTADIYRNLTEYARNGGTLFLGIPQLNTDPDRGQPWKLINDGDLRELCGVKVKGPEKKPKEIPAWTTGSAAVARVVRCSVCGLARGEKFVLHRPQRLCEMTLHGASAVAVSLEGQPVLLEHAVGKGRVLLLALWNWPGNLALKELTGAIVKGLLSRFGHPMRLAGSRWVDWTECKWDGNCSNIYLLNTNLHAREKGTLNIKAGLEVPFDLAPGELSVLYRNGPVVIWADDPMLAVTPRAAPEGQFEFELNPAVISGRETTVSLLVQPGMSIRRLTLDGKPVKTRRGLSGSFRLTKRPAPRRLAGIR